jgi:hypothetical protein
MNKELEAHIARQEAAGECYRELAEINNNQVDREYIFRWLRTPTVMKHLHDVVLKHNPFYPRLKKSDDE